MSGIPQAKYERAVDLIAPSVTQTLERAPSGARFTILQLVRALRRDEQGEAAYQSALEVLADNPGWSHAAAQVLHGQVIPSLLRASASVRFAGFAHDAPADERDGTAVPTYWRKL
jgi:hypothetical protein